MAGAPQGEGGEVGIEAAPFKAADEIFPWSGPREDACG